MPYKKALEELGISREKNIERVEHLATEMDIKDLDDDVNITNINVSVMTDNIMSDSHPQGI